MTAPGAPAAVAAPPRTGSVRPDQRERILEVAARLMAESGLHATSMRALAAACELNVATIYHYFPSKQALFDAVVTSRQFDARMSEAPDVDADAPLEARVRDLVGWILHRASEHEDIWRLLLGESLRRTPEAMAAARGLTELFEAMLTDWFDRFVPDLPVDRADAAKVVRAAVYGLLVETLLQAPGESREDLLDTRAAEVARVLAAAAR